MTGIWQSVSLLACDPVHIQEVFVQTSVRRHTIQATVTVRNEGNSLCTARMTNEIVDCDGPAKRLPPATFILLQASSQPQAAVRQAHRRCKLQASQKLQASSYKLQASRKPQPASHNLKA